MIEMGEGGVLKMSDNFSACTSIFHYSNDFPEKGS